MTKEETLKRANWKEVIINKQVIGWKSPVSLTGMDHYFTLDAAYQMETEDDIYRFSAESARAIRQRMEDSSNG